MMAIAIVSIVSVFKIGRWIGSVDSEREKFRAFVIEFQDDLCEGQ